MPETTFEPNYSPELNRPLADCGKVKSQLLSVISAAETFEIADLLDQIWRPEAFKITQAPETGLIMIAVKDPFGVDFFLGEALITRAEAAAYGLVGVGTILGNAPESALLLAVVEILEQSGDAAALHRVQELINRLGPRADSRKTLTAKMSAATVVDFESMKKERVDFGSLGD